MEFFVRKNSNEPILKMQLIQDGRSDFKHFHDKLSNADIRFSMRDVENGAYVLLNKAAGIVAKTTIQETDPPEYYIYYRWQSSDTQFTGRYQGQFAIKFIEDCSELIVPVREDLFININDSFVESNCTC